MYNRHMGRKILFIIIAIASLGAVFQIALEQKKERDAKAQAFMERTGATTPVDYLQRVTDATEPTLQPPETFERAIDDEYSVRLRSDDQQYYFELINGDTTQLIERISLDDVLSTQRMNYTDEEIVDGRYLVFIKDFDGQIEQSVYDVQEEELVFQDFVTQSDFFADTAYFFACNSSTDGTDGRYELRSLPTFETMSLTENIAGRVTCDVVDDAYVEVRVTTECADDACTPDVTDQLDPKKIEAQ